MTAVASPSSEPVTQSMDAQAFDRVLVWRAWITLLVVDLLLMTGGFPRLRRFVAVRRIRRRADPNVDRVVAAFDRAAVWWVRPAQCLQRSAALTCLLRARGVPARMVIGARKIPFYGHAWVEVEGSIISERANVASRFPELDRF